MKIHFRLREKITLITFTIVILAIGFTTYLNVYDFIGVHKERVAEKIFTREDELKKILEDLNKLGFELKGLDGITRECQNMVSAIKYASYCFVTDTKGEVCYHTSPGETGKVYADPETKRSLASTEKLVQYFKTDKGEKYYDYSLPVFKSGDERLGTVRIGVSSEIVDHEIARIVKRAAASGLIFIIITGLLTSVLFRYSILAPIRTLMQGMARFGKGDLNARVNLATNDEISEIAGSFNEMAENIVLSTTERQKTQDELKRSEKRFKDVALSMADWIWEVDEKGVYTYSSEKTKELLGYENKDIIGKTPFDLMPPEEAEKVEKIFSGVVRKKENIRDMENWNITKDGRRICFLTNAVPILDDQGNLKGYRGVDKNITEQKLAGEEKKKLQEKLIHSEKIAAVGQMAGGIAHEVNNPLGVILGFAQFIRMRMKEEDPFYFPVQSIEREALRCKKLIVDLLTFSRTGKTMPEMIDIVGVIEETLPLVEAQVRVRNVEIARDYGSDIPKVMAVKDKLQQVFLNLCNNALDAMPGGGKLFISVKKLDKWLAVEIADTGQGMTEEIKNHIFEPFFTTKDVGKGTGLGLSVSHEMIVNQGGIMEFTTAEGKGTTFIIKLPLN